jgi:ribosomal small subunit protein bTHX
MLRFLVALCFLLIGASAFTVPTGASVVRAPVVSRADLITMGRGDRRTTKGKRARKSFGNARPRNAELRKRKAANAAAGGED